MSSEYSYWLELFRSKQFEKNLIHLKKVLRNKRVIFYCNGIYFDALSEAYNLSEYFNVVGVSDIRYQTDNNIYYKAFRCIKPDELKLEKVDCIIVTSPNPTSIRKYLENSNLLPRRTKVIALNKVEINLEEKLRLAFEYSLINFDFYKGAKYFLFCSQEELQTKLNYEKVLKCLKNNPYKRIRALFVCEENSKWGYQGIYDRLSQDRRFEVLPVLLFPIVTKNRIEFTQKENAEFFNTLGIETIDGYDYEKNANLDIKDFEPDIVFYEQPWYLQGVNNPVKVSEYALTVMIPYGYTTLNPKSWGSDSVKKVYSNLWMFFSESPYHNEFYEKTANMKFKDNLLATGTPKMDYYKKTVDEYFEKIWKGDGKRVIWAPHHSIGNKGLGMSNFEEYYNFFLELAKSHQELSFVFKPHPALRSSCISSKFMSEEEYDSYIEEWNNLPNATVYNLGNYFDIFKTSDMLITDCSSFLAEYFPSKKPIILLDRDSRASFDEFGEKLKKGFYIANNQADILGLLKHVLLLNKDGLKDVRKKILDNTFYLPEKPSSDIIVEYLNNILR